MASTADIKNGVVLSIDGQLWSVVEFQHVKPGKGGAFVRTKLKNVMTGKVVDKTFNAGAKVEIENVDRRDFTYLYNDGEGFVFMDVARLRPDHGRRRNGRRCRELPAGEPAGADRPQQRQPALHRAAGLRRAGDHLHRAGLQGDRSSAGTKPATVETGYEIQVPLFLETGTKVKVDTRTGDYLGRVN